MSYSYIPENIFVRTNSSRPTTAYVHVHMRACVDDIGDYIKDVTEKERNLRSIMKSEMHATRRTVISRYGRSQIAETPSRYASDRKAATKGEWGTGRDREKERRRTKAERVVH